MSPEQAAGRSDMIDGRSDVYSWGALLRFMLTREHPAAEGSGVWPREVPKQLRAIVDKARVAAPEGRYKSVDSMADDLARYLDGGAVTAYRETPWERIGRLFLKYQTPILLVTAYVVVRLILLLVRE